WGTHQSNLRYAAEQEQLSVQRSAVAQKIAVAEVEKFGQGALAISKSIPEPRLDDWYHIDYLSKTSLLPQKQSPYRDTALSVAFSKDEKYFATVSPGVLFNHFSIYSTESKEQVCQFYFNSCPEDWSSMGLLDDPSKSSYVQGLALFANPCYCNEVSSDPVKSARFVIIRSNGAFAFISTNEDQKIVWRNLNDINGRTEKNEFTLCYSVLSNAENAILASGDCDGNITLFSFPEGKFIKQVSARPNLENNQTTMACPNLVFSSSGRELYSFCGGSEIKQWGIDGTLINSFNLPLETMGEYINNFGITPDGQQIIVGLSSGKKIVWNIRENKMVAEVMDKEYSKAMGSKIHHFLNELIQLVTDQKKSLSDKVMWINNAILSSLQHKHKEGTGRQECIYAIDNERFLSFGELGPYQIWNWTKKDAKGDWETSLLQSDSSNPKMGILAVAISPSRKACLVSEANGDLSLFDMETGKITAISEGLLAFGVPQGRRGVFHQGKKRILVPTFAPQPLMEFDPDTLQIITQYCPIRDLTYEEYIQGKASVHSIAVPEKGNSFAILLGTGDIQYFELGNPYPVKILAHVCPGIENNPLFFEGNRLAASPQVTRLAAKFAKEDRIVVWKWKETKEERFLVTRYAKENKMDPIGLFNDIFFLNENELLELRTEGFRRWNVETGEQISEHRIWRHSQAVTTCCSLAPTNFFREEHDEIALGLIDGSVVIVGIKDGLTLHSTNIFSSRLSAMRDDQISVSKEQSDGRTVTGISWSRDRSLIAVAYFSGKVVLYATSNFAPLAAVQCGRSSSTHNPNGLLVDTVPFITDL
ncbi:MAG: hypothetical protein Q4G59_03810, partial [Planctomycetia bacterium]|nr:hypothetical protein [Planctomycetia bacterium]